MGKCNGFWDRLGAQALLIIANKRRKFLPLSPINPGLEKFILIGSLEETTVVNNDLRFEQFCESRLDSQCWYS